MTPATATPFRERSSRTLQDIITVPTLFGVVSESRVFKSVLDDGAGVRTGGRPTADGTRAYQKIVCHFKSPNPCRFPDECETIKEVKCTQTFFIFLS